MFGICLDIGFLVDDGFLPDIPSHLFPSDGWILGQLTLLFFYSFLGEPLVCMGNPDESSSHARGYRQER